MRRRNQQPSRIAATARAIPAAGMAALGVSRADALQAPPASLKISAGEQTVSVWQVPSLQLPLPQPPTTASMVGPS